jgi:hypothetical protein
VYVGRIVERFVRVPNDGKRSGDVGMRSTVLKTHRIAVDRVGQKLSIHLPYSSFDIELTNESSADNELRNVLDFDQNAFLVSGWHENVGRFISSGSNRQRSSFT